MYVLYAYIQSYLHALRIVSRWYPASLKQPVASFKSVGKNVFDFGIGLQGSTRRQNSPNCNFERVQHKPIYGIHTINIPGAHDPNHFCRSCKKTWTPSMHWHLKAGFSRASRHPAALLHVQKYWKATAWIFVTASAILFPRLQGSNSQAPPHSLP